MAARKPLVEEVGASRSTTLDYQLWNRMLRAANARLADIEVVIDGLSDSTRALLDAGLARINEILTPAALRIQHIAELGFLLAHSETLQTLTPDATMVFVIGSGDERELFTPSPHILIGRTSTPDDYAIAMLNGYDREHGELTVTIQTVTGDEGPHSDWLLSGLAGDTLAAKHFMEVAQAAVANIAGDAAAIAATTVGLAATTAANTAVNSAIAALVGAAPAQLDTLAEISAALGGDANLAATLTSAIALKINTSAIGVSVQAYDAATLKGNVERQTALTGGAATVEKDLGTIAAGTVTPHPGDRSIQRYTNAGSHTLAPAGVNGSLMLTVVNASGAGAITVSGWTKVNGAFDTTNGHKFRCAISMGADGSLLVIQPMF